MVNLGCKFGETLHVRRRTHPTNPLHFARHILQSASCTAATDCTQSVTRLGSSTAALHAPASHHCHRFAPTLAQPGEQLGRVLADPSDEAAAHLGVQTGAPAGPGTQLGRLEGRRTPRVVARPRRLPDRATREIFVVYWYLFSNHCSVLLLTAASSCMCSQAGGVREPLRPRAALFPNQAHAGRLRVRSTTTLRRSRRCLTSGLMQTTTTRSRMSAPKPSWLRAQVSAFCPSCVVRLGAAWRVAEFNLGFRTECRASRLMVCECAQTRVEACDAPEGSESCKATTSQGGSPEAARTTSWHHFAFRCCRRLRAVRTRHCAAASTRGSCGAWGLEWPVFRTASGCAADEPPYSRSRAGASNAVADVPALFELRAVGRAGGAASPRVPAP